MTTGLIVASVGMGLLTQIDIDSSYVTHILPGLVIMGLGLGATMAPAMQGAISGVDPDDSGVASATVNTMQQVGGSIGTALLSTVAANAATSYVSTNMATATDAALLQANAEIASYTTTFWWASGIFLLGAVLSATLLKKGPLPSAPEGAVVVGH